MSRIIHTQATPGRRASTGARIAGVRIMVNDTSDERSTPTHSVWCPMRTVYFADLPRRDASILVGRSPACDLVIEHRTVSAQHCRIECARGTGGFTIEDCGSSNGVYIANGGPSDIPRRVDWGQLTLGCYVYLGDIALVPVDGRGDARIVAAHVSEYMRHAHALYGSGSRLARHLGIAGSVYDSLARFWRGSRASV